MNDIDVAVGIILDTACTRVLIAQRNTVDQHFGKWEFPGGKINSDESAEQALRRELNEELGIWVNDSEPFNTFDYKYSQQSISLKIYLVKDITGEPRGREGQRIRWVDINELNGIDMLKANEDIIAMLLEKLRVNDL